MPTYEIRLPSTRGLWRTRIVAQSADKALAAALDYFTNVEDDVLDGTPMVEESTGPTSWYVD